jgi:hypothetical protein
MMISQTEFIAALQTVTLALEHDKARVLSAVMALEKTGLFEASAEIKNDRGLPDRLAATETAIFDNWGAAKRPKNAQSAKRFGLTFKGWFADRPYRNRLKTPDLKYEGKLHNRKELLQLMNEWERKARAVSPDYIAFLRSAADEMGDDWLIAPLYYRTKGDGQPILNFTFAMCERSKVEAAKLAEGDLRIIGPDRLAYSITKFSPLDATNTKLSGKVILQSRGSNTPNDNWSIGPVISTK